MLRNPLTGQGQVFSLTLSSWRLTRSDGAHLACTEVVYVNYLVYMPLLSVVVFLRKDRDRDRQRNRDKDRDMEANIKTNRMSK